MATRSAKLYQGEDMAPVLDYTDQVIWEESEFGTRAWQGDGNPSTVVIRDPLGEQGNSADLPSGLSARSLAAKNLFVIDLDGDYMFRGRVGVKNYSRDGQLVERYRQVECQLHDTNWDLDHIFVNAYSRPSETDNARIQGIIASYLSGDPRPTTHLNGSNFLSGSNTVTLAAEEYNRTSPLAMIRQISRTVNKQFFLTGDTIQGGSLFWDGNDSTVYQAGIRISDRLSEENRSGSCAGGGEVAALLGVAASNGGTNHTSDYAPWAGNREERVEIAVAQAVPVGWTIIAVVANNLNSTGANANANTVYDEQGNTWTQDAVHTNTASSQDDRVEIWRCNVTTALASGDYIRWAVNLVASLIADTETGGRAIGAWAYPAALSSPSVGTGAGTINSSVSITAPAGDVVVAGLSATHAPANDTASLTPDADWDAMLAHTRVNGSGNLNKSIYAQQLSDSAGEGWTVALNQAWDWSAIAVGYTSAPITSPTLTFPPIWNVGPSSTEDGSEQLCEVVLYYGTNADQYVTTHNLTVHNQYGHASATFTDDADISAATALLRAKAILAHRQYEDKTYNVTIGPLTDEQVLCVKHGQTMQIKARAIPDADDQFRTMRIVQCRYTTPVPGTWFAHLQLGRPWKLEPYGSGPTLVPTSAGELTIADAGGYYTGTTVEAALQELGGSSGLFWYNVRDYGATGDGVTDDRAGIVAAIAAATAAGGGVVWFPGGTYIISATINLPANIHLRGASPASAPILASSFSGTLFSITGSGAGIHDLYIDHAGFSVGSARTGAIISLGATEVDLLQFTGLRTVSNGTAIVSAHATAQHSDVWVADCAFFRHGSNGTILDLDSIRNVHFSSVACFTSGVVTEANVVIPDGSEDVHWSGGHIHGDLTIGGDRIQVVGSTIHADVTLEAASNDCVVLGNSIGGTLTDSGTDNIIPSASVSTLNDLTDVTITAAATGDMLRYNGTAWVDTPGRWEVVTNGVDVLVWSGDELVHEWTET